MQKQNELLSDSILSLEAAEYEQRSQEQLRLRFIAAATRLVTLAGRSDMTLRSHNDPSLPYFSALPSFAQEMVLRGLTDYANVCEQIQQQGISARDSKALTWRMLKYLKLTPLADAFEDVESTDFLEIYNEHHQMVFASLNFLSLCSYTLEDLYCRPWMDLYARDEAITRQLYEAASLVLSGTYRKTLALDIPAHEASEKEGPKKALVQPRFFSPVFENGRPAGFFCKNILHRFL